MTPTEKNNHPKGNILIVDDNMDTVELLRKRFRAEGYDTDEAYDGETGLNKVYEYDPDLIILDIMMPGIDGLDVCRRLKKDASVSYIPVLMLTARDAVPDKVKGLDTGADAYITKPFDYQELSALVNSLLLKKQERARLIEKEKSFALDHMVDEVSHEVRNPLVAIGGFARRLLKILPEGSDGRKYAEVIVKNTQSLEKMVEHLIALKSATISYPEECSINEILQTVLDRNAELFGKRGIRVETEFMENPPPLQVDRENIEKALANIIDNSVEAMENKKDGRLRIETSIQDGYFETVISDNGKGIPRNKVKQIYDPFFTTKTYGPGLGLTYALKTIQNHKGMISVHSTEGEETEFIIRLPLHIHIHDNGKRPAPEVEPRKGGSRKQPVVPDSARVY